jgi:hypothetical protein
VYFEKATRNKASKKIILSKRLIDLATREAKKGVLEVDKP